MKHLLLSSLLLAAACGGDSDSSTALITTAEGGVLDVGEATISIPAGAVATDVEMTVRVATDGEFEAPDGGDTIWVVEPATVLEVGADVVMQIPGDVPADSFAEIQTFGDGVWFSPSGQSTSETEVTLNTTFLGVFAVVIRQNQGS